MLNEFQAIKTRYRDFRTFTKLPEMCDIECFYAIVHSHREAKIEMGKQIAKQFINYKQKQKIRGIYSIFREVNRKSGLRLRV